MTKLKLSSIPDDRPVKVTVELPAGVHRDLVAYAEILARTNREATPLHHFMATDRAFAKARKERKVG